MKTTRPIILLAALALPTAVCGFLFVTHRPAPETPPAQTAIPRKLIAAENPAPPVLTPTEPLESAPPPADSGIPETPAAAESKPSPPSAQAAPKAAMKSPPANPSAPPAPRAKKVIQDPVAREALYFVGADPRANEYWFAAINDPSLSAHERKDLIEDLNEDGLLDPKHPTADDLPLIVSRIALIEAIGGEPMDEVNAAAFMEAYKDLVKLADRAASDAAPRR